MLSFETMHRLYLLGRTQLVVGEGAAEREIALQPKPMALLAFLAIAASTHGSLARDAAVALLWPDLDEVRARATLRQTLFYLRHRIPAGSLPARSDDTLRLDCSVLWFDVAALRAAAASGDVERASELFGGDLLQSFHIQGASPELEQWLDHARHESRAIAHHAAWAAAEHAAARGDVVTSARLARRAATLAPYDEIIQRKVITLLNALGDRLGALCAGRDLERRMLDEYGTHPAPETRRLLESLRLGIASR
jgi:DNA-binding SARP family transcriptional activator